MHMHVDIVIVNEAILEMGIKISLLLGNWSP